MDSRTGYLKNGKDIEYYLELQKRESCRGYYNCLHPEERQYIKDEEAVSNIE